MQIADFDTAASQCMNAAFARHIDDELQMTDSQMAQGNVSQS